MTKRDHTKALFGGPPALEGDRDGSTYERPLDLARLNKQARIVWDVMCLGSWWTLEELADRTGAPEASISARLRDFRKDRFGGHTVERRRVGKKGSGRFEYRLLRHGKPPIRNLP